MKQIGKHITVCYLYRKPQYRYFSIEKIFKQIAGILKDKIGVKEFHASFDRFQLSHIWRNLCSVRKETADLYHVTGDTHYLVLGLPRNQTILTIHDSVFICNTTGLKQWVLTFFLLKLPVMHCRLVTTISEKSRQEIIKYAGCTPDKVIVVPNPVGEKFYYQPKDFNTSSPTLLFIGTTPNKNLERIVDAITGMKCRLMIIGRIDETQQQKLDQAKIAYTLHSGLSEQQLADTYSESDIVLFPSTYEGFGLPIIEGQKSGRPVITSNISPMKEVAGKGACLVDPFDILSIRNGIGRVIQDVSYRKSIVEEGFVNVKLYDPTGIAERYLSLYESILS